MAIKLSIKMTPEGNAIAKGMGKLKFKQMADSELGELSKRINANIQDEAPKRTGKLAKAHRQHKLKQMAYEGYVDGRTKASRYYPFVIKGVGPRMIAPRVKKALYWPGARHPVKVVKRWPGFKGNDYVSRALDGSSGDIKRTEQDLAVTIERAITG